jgi:hypothetical protein
MRLVGKYVGGKLLSDCGGNFVEITHNVLMSNTAKTIPKATGTRRST